MNDFLLKIKDKLKIFVPFRKMNPHTYWNNILHIFLIIIVILIFFSFYLLYKIRNQQIFQIIQVSTEVPSLVDEKLLDRVKESFEDKQIRQREIKEGLDIYKDPSR